MRLFKVSMGCGLKAGIHCPGVVVGIRSIEPYDLVKIKPAE